mgnify:CR=1 FL=1
MRKVTITERRVYHKVAKIEVEIPKDIPSSDVNEWLLENNEKWEEDLDDKFNYGYYMNEPQSDSETRYDVINENYGGHL